MEKDSKRADYVKKQHHHHKEKLEKTEKEELSSHLIDQLNFRNVEQLIGFMQEHYEDFTKKHEENIHKIGKIVFKQLLELRGRWFVQQRTKMVGLMQGEGIPFDETMYNKIQEQKQSIYKAQYSVVKDTNQDLQLLYLKVIIFSPQHKSQPKSCHYFVVEQSMKKLMSWQVENKRFKKDIIFYCKQFKEFQEEVAKVQAKNKVY